MEKRLGRLAGRVGFFAALTIMTVFAGFPLLWMFVSSLKSSSEIMKAPPTLIPKTVVLSNYLYVLTRTRVPLYLWNTAVVSAGTILITLAIAIFGAYSLARFTYRGKRLLGNLLLVTYMFSPIILAIPLYTLLGRFGLVNTRLGLVLAYTTFGVPFGVWLLWPFFKSLPVEMEEAAMVDGASRVGAFMRVILPNAIPGVVATAIYTLILVWDDLLYALVLCSSESTKTITLGIASFIGGEIVEWEHIMATGTVVTVIVLGFFLIIQRYLVKGWGAGSVKG